MDAADEPTTDRRDIRPPTAAEAYASVTRYWLSEIAKIEEQIEPGDGTRWSILKSAMQGIARGEKR